MIQNRAQMEQEGSQMAQVGAHIGHVGAHNGSVRNLMGHDGSSLGMIWAGQV